MLACKNVLPMFANIYVNTSFNQSILTSVDSLPQISCSACGTSRQNNHLSEEGSFHSSRYPQGSLSRVLLLQSGFLFSHQLTSCPPPQHLVDLWVSSRPVPPLSHLHILPVIRSLSLLINVPNISARPPLALSLNHLALKK